MTTTVDEMCEIPQLTVPSGKESGGFAVDQGWIGGFAVFRATPRHRGPFSRTGV